MSKCLVTIAMTTYNGERFLADQLESLLQQTLVPDKIIVCDDRSTDGTVDILERFRQSHGIEYHVNQQRLGIKENFKKAVRLAPEGHYVALCDQDDIWLPEKLSEAVKALSSIDDQKTPCMVYSDLVVIDGQNRVLHSSLNSTLGTDKYEHCLETLVFGNFVLGCTTVMNLPMRIYFDQIPRGNFNHDAWITLVAFTFGRVLQLPDPLIRYRQHQLNATYADHKKTNRFQRVLRHLSFLFSRNDYLHHQAELLKSFMQVYDDKLTEAQKRQMMLVVQLEHRSYLRKKIALERAFRGKWINRFSGGHHA